MSSTSLGLNGSPATFLGAYIKNISSNLGLSINPSTITITLAEDPTFGVYFTEPTVGKFYNLELPNGWSFGGVITKFERDIRSIGGRLIRVYMSDPREVMKSIPVILAPGSQLIASTIADTECSVLDLFGAYDIGGGALNLSLWNEAGMYYSRLVSALQGENILFGETIIPVTQQIAKAFGERYRFDLTEVSDKVDSEYRINTNLSPISNIIEDLSTKYAFDWFVESTRASDNIIDVTIKIIDRTSDNIDISLQDFLDEHPNRVISATSGVELRNDVACVALQGALVEQLQRIEILGQANEPIDLSAESGSNDYVMTETEMRVVLSGRHQWELWLASQSDQIPSGVSITQADVDNGLGLSRRGYSRYGGALNDFDINPILTVRNSQEFANLVALHPNIPRNPFRTPYNLAAAQYENSGKIFQKLQAHAEKTYGKRWVHNPVSDEVIDSAWTRDAVGTVSSSTSIGANDPNEYFRQSDGKTRAYVEFTNQDAGGAFDIGLGNLTDLFGDQDIFRNITRFGRNFSNVLPGDPGQYGAVLNLELINDFDPQNAVVTQLDKSDYTYNNSTSSVPSVKTSLYVAATIDKDGVVTIDAPVTEPSISEDDLFRLIRASISGLAGNLDIAGIKANANLQIEAAGGAAADLMSPTPDGDLKNRVVPAVDMELEDLNAQIEDADGNFIDNVDRLLSRIKRLLGNNIFNMSVRCYQPKYVYIPVRSRYNRYGPVFSDSLDGTAQGKLEIIQDDGFSPWEFGSASTMLTAMQKKVNNATSLQKEVFSASISVEGFPQYSIGQSLEKNSNITSINISFGDSVTTSYQLQTFLRKFGEFTKEDWARLALFANSGALKISPSQQVNFMDRASFRVTKQSRGNGSYGSRNTGGAKDLG